MNSQSAATIDRANHRDIPTNQGRRKRPRVSDANRKRVAQACISCRRLKEKCQGGRPCNRCTKLKRECTFLEASKPHIRRTPIAIDRSNESDNAELSSDSEHFTIDPVSGNSAHYSGELSHSNFSLRLQQRVDGEESTQNPRSQATALAMSLHKPSKLLEAVAAFPPFHVANFLLDIFFDFAQTNYFYVDEQSLRRKLSWFSLNSQAPSIDDSPLVATMLMAFAVGTQFAHLSAVSQEHVRNNLQDYASPDDAVALGFYNSAKELIPDVLSAASTESVQAFLLFGVYALPIDAGGLSWIYFGIALRIAIQNGMHRKQKKGLDAREAELRRRIWWTAYTLERRISVLHGKPVSIVRADVDVDLPSELAALDAMARIDTLPNIIAMIKLTDGLERARNQIFELRQCPKKERSAKMASVLSLREQLEAYWQSLPDNTYCKDLTPGRPLFRFNTHLALTYHLIHIFIGRSFILKGMHFNMSTPTSTSSRDRQPRDWSEKCNILIEECVDNALKVIDLCQMLHDEVGLSRSSYTEYTSCCAALLVVLAKRIVAGSNQLQQACAKGLKLIQHMAVGLYSDKSEKLVVEALETAICRLNSAKHGNSKVMSISGYASFKNWALDQQSVADQNELGRSFMMYRTNLYDTDQTGRGKPEMVCGPWQSPQMQPLEDDSGVYLHDHLQFEDFAAIPGLEEWFQYGLQ